MTTNISGYNSQDYTVHYCATENGTYTATEPSWMSAEVYYTNDWVVYWHTDQNTSSIPNECYFKVYNSANNVYSNVVHVTQSAHVGISTTVTIEPNSSFSNDLNNNPNGGLLVATVTANNQPIQANLTWTSSNTSVATVDQYGLVTLVAIGQTTITATYAGDNTYAGSVGTYQLNVINSAPWATATPGTLNNFSYNEGYGPSAVQTISVEGDNLASNVLVELDGLSGSSFEISEDGTTWTNSIDLQPTNGTLAATNISVRMKAGLVTGASYSDQLRVKYNGSNMASISLSGSVNTITIMTVAEARAAIDQGTPYPTGVYVSGIVTRRYNNNPPSDGKLSYYISDDGTQTNELEAYQGKGLNGANFTSYTDIEPGDIVVIYGDLYYHSNSSTYELNTGNYLFSWRRPVTLTVSGLSNVETFVFNAADQSMPLLEGEGSCVFDAGDEVMISVSTESSYILSTFTLNGVDHLNDIEADAYTFTINQNTTVTATAVQAYNINYSVNGVLTQAQVPGSFQLPTSANLNSDEFVFAGWTTNPNVVTGFSTAGTTVNVQGGETFYAVYGKTTADGPATTVYQKVTSAPTDGDWSGDYLIVYDNGIVLDSHYDKLNVNTYGTYEDISEYYDNGEIEYNSITSAFEITAEKTSNGYSLYDNDDEAFLGFNSTGNSNTGAKLRWDEEFATSRNEWTLGVGSIVSVFNNQRAIRWNDNSSSYRFAIYTPSGQEPIQLFKKTTIASTTTTYYTRVFINETATDDIEIVGPSIIPSGSMLDMDGNTLTNDNPANLIIEDGGQLISGPVQGTMLKNITGTDFGSQQSPTNAGYCVFASPINPFDEDDFVGIPPTDVNGLITNPSTSYDLYSYDAEKDDEWRNYKQMTNDFILDPCRGYLYANQNNTTLYFQGELNSLNEYFMGVDLAYGGEGDDLKNLTLVGNSYAYRKTFQISQEAVYDHRVETYYLTITTNGDSFELHPVEVGEDAFGDEVSVMTLDPMEAVFVYATDEDQFMGLSDVVLGTSRENRNVNVKVSRKNGDLLDNAIVSFGGSMMKKLYLTDNSTRVYFPISNQDYAVVRAQSEGEQPVNFKAKENGTYTLSIETKNVEMDYLHLIDNMTGADVDLLATPSYTFEAKTSDYASRFRLVFSANSISEDADGDNAFAYFNGSNWTVSNMGEATLQVVDVMGRVLSSETLSGNAEVNINQPTGVYMLRLVNGDNVKVQKVVVR